MVLSCLFLSEKKRFSSIRVLKVVFETQLYTTISFIVGNLIGITDISLLNIVKTIMSPVSGAYWFVTAYLIMITAGPYIGKACEYMNYSLNVKIAGIFTLIVMYISLWDLSKASDLIFVLYIYYIVSIVKKYRILESGYFTDIRRNFLLIACMWIIGCLLWIAATYLGIGRLAGILTRRYSLWTLMIAMLMVFSIKASAFEIRYRKIILCISRSTLAIYLLQENMWLRSWIIYKVFHLDVVYAENNMFLLIAITDVLIVMIVAILIDCFRRNILEKNLFRFLQKYSIWNRIDDFMSP